MMTFLGLVMPTILFLLALALSISAHAGSPTSEPGEYRITPNGAGGYFIRTPHAGVPGKIIPDGTGGYFVKPPEQAPQKKN